MKRLFLRLGTIGFLALPFFVAAQSIQNPLAATSITGLFQSIIEIIMVFAIPVIVFFIVYAGFLYVTARGDTGQIQKAHQALLYAVIGGVIIIGANVLIDVVAGTVNSIK